MHSASAGKCAKKKRLLLKYSYGITSSAIFKFTGYIKVDNYGDMGPLPSQGRGLWRD